jgi:hypothetical protein
MVKSNLFSFSRKDVDFYSDKICSLIDYWKMDYSTFNISDIANSCFVKTILGFGGSHVYYSQINDLTVSRSIDLYEYSDYFKDSIAIGFENGFLEKNMKSLNVIFSFPSMSVRIDKDTVDEIYNGVYVKTLPFEQKEFSVIDKLKKYFNQNTKFKIFNDTPAVNFFNIFKNKKSDLYLGVVSGTGINISCTIDGKIINTEFGGRDIFKRNEYDILIDKESINPDLECTEKLASYPFLQKIHTKYNIPMDVLIKRSAGVIASGIIGFIKYTKAKSASICFQGSFVCKDDTYFNLISDFIKSSGFSISILRENKADILGASLV